MRLGWVVAYAAGCVLATGCGGRNGGNGSPRDSGGDMDAEGDAGGGAECSSSGECDDGQACTVDTCSAAGVCRHETLSERCPDGQRCTLTGCNAGCETHDDCNDGNYCNGAEQCINNECKDSSNFASITPIDCNDNNECTVDTCDEEFCEPDDPANTCCRVMNTCEFDGGPLPDAAAFDPSMHYTGTFALVGGSPACGGGGFDYSVSTLTFSSAGGTLSVRDDGLPCILQGTLPTDENFSVNCSAGCGSEFTLAGAFVNADRFMASWTATFSGGCACVDESLPVLQGNRQ
jgi:hypothetical protein